MPDNKNIKPITVKTFADHEMTCETKFVAGRDHNNSEIHNDAFDFATYIYDNTSAAFWEPFSRRIQAILREKEESST